MVKNQLLSFLQFAIILNAIVYVVDYHFYNLFIVFTTNKKSNYHGATNRNTFTHIYLILKELNNTLNTTSN